MSSFAEQAFLFEFIDKFKNEVFDPEKSKEFSNDLMTFKQFSPKSYEYIMRIDGDPTSSINKIMYSSMKNSRRFDAFSPHQLSLLTPKIVIYKVRVVEGKEIAVPFPINQSTTEESIIQSIEGRGTDVALKSISWHDTGTDPAYAGLTMAGTISLTFQSFESLFMDRSVPGSDEPVNFGRDLTTNAPSNANRGKGGSTRIGILDANKPIFAPFETRLVVGWSAPTDPSNIFTPGELESIEEAQSVLNITINRVDLSIDDGGKVDVNCQFTGRLETAMSTQKYDLFMIDPASMDQQTVQQTLTVLKDVQKNINKQIAEQEKLGDAGEDMVAALEAKRKITTQEILQVRAQNLEIAWGKFLGRIQSMGKKNPTDTGRLFYTDLTHDAVNAYTEMVELRKLSRQAKAMKKKQEQNDTLVTISEEMIKDYDKKRKVLGEKLQKIVPGIVENSTDQRILQANKIMIDGEDDEANQKATAAFYKGLISSDGTMEIKDPKIAQRINFFFLGDLFESALDIVINRPESYPDNCTVSVAGKQNPDSKKMKGETRIMLGTIGITNPQTGKLMTKNIADLPIAVSSFLKWWEINVIKQKKSALPLRTFLAGMTSLVGGVLRTQPAPDADSRAPSSRIKLTTLEIPKGGILDNIWNKHEKRIKIEDLVQLREQRMSNTDGQKSRTVSFLYLYTNNLPQPKKNSQEQLKANLTNGIPHLYVGNRDGIVKNIAFKRTPIQGHRESSILRSVQGGRQFQSVLLSSDKYDADIEMFGNPFYKPGMQIYVDPRSLGLGYSVGTKWATDLGLGGLYTVIAVKNDIGPGNYTTRLTTKSEVGLGLQGVIQKAAPGDSKEQKIDSVPKHNWGKSAI